MDLEKVEVAIRKFIAKTENLSIEVIKQWQIDITSVNEYEAETTVFFYVHAVGWRTYESVAVETDENGNVTVHP